LADDGSLYDTVQAAENTAKSFVLVPPGTFNESVTIDTAVLTLLGSANSTHIRGSTNTIRPEASNITIENLRASSVTDGSPSGSDTINNTRKWF